MEVHIDTMLFTSNGVEHKTKRIDWHDSSDRKWLMNHLHHCMMNDKSVTLTPQGPDSTQPKEDS